MNIISPSLDDYRMKDFNEIPNIFEVFVVSDSDMEIANGNTGIIIDMKFPDSSQKARDLFCVYIVLHQLRNLLVEPLTAQTYTQIYSGYSETNWMFINWIMNKLVVKPEYIYYSRHIRDILEWNLQRTNSSLILDNHSEFHDIIDPPDIADPPDNLRLDNPEDFMDIERQNGGSKRKRKHKSKKSRRSQKKERVNRKTKKHRIIKRK
uniref:Uncharacterized protein n=1 Tax=viral metagenome TaxID=1070528 RepID=A0A6C0E910_9ZZZZ